VPLQIRDFIKKQGLDIKTTGKGRTKAAILQDVQALMGARASVDAAATPKPAAATPEPAAATPKPDAVAPKPAAAAPSPPPPTPPSTPPAAREELAQTEADEAADEEEAPAPKGFEWGGTF
jgi:hypothetical protein